jgi:hypothetical protein
LYSEYQRSGTRTSTSATSLRQISYGLPWEQNWLSVVRSLNVTRLLMRTVLRARKEKSPSLVSHHTSLRVYSLHSSSHSVDANGGSDNLRLVKCLGFVKVGMRVQLRVNCQNPFMRLSSKYVCT